jgi:hypothetical protein
VLPIDTLDDGKLLLKLVDIRQHTTECELVEWLLAVKRCGLLIGLRGFGLAPSELVDEAEIEQMLRVLWRQFDRSSLLLDHFIDSA